MRIYYLKSASVLIEDQGKKILCDPWLVDGEYYGSWAHYPPCTFVPEDFNDVDAIYISHIHPDHFSKKTLERMNRSIPIYIHRYEEQFLKGNLERMGFPVFELPHNSRTRITGDLHLNILAADNCNPELCGQFFGCGLVEAKFGSTQIDSICVIDNCRQVVVNVNDCPIDLSRDAAKNITELYPRIDFLLLGYGGAGPYPQCFASLTDKEKRIAAKKKKLQFFRQGEEFISLFRPNWFMPFAGRYTLSGNYTSLNEMRGVPEIEEAAYFFSGSAVVQESQSTCVLLNSMAFFDLESGETSEPYTTTDLQAKRIYCETVLETRPFDFDSYPLPTIQELTDLIPAAIVRLEKKRTEISLETSTLVYVYLTEGKAVRISLNGEQTEIVPWNDRLNAPAYVSMTCDSRLLLWILKGPRFAHWNNAEIGSHIQFERKPDKFERGIYHCMCYFHA